jgi:murein DD-endopeptidase MepM/ murein hydrolase activator NlpD
MSRYRMPFKKLGDLYGSTAGRKQPHRGLDFPQATGAKVRAVASGTISQVGYSEYLGHYVILLDYDGIFWGFNHLSDTVGMRHGKRVRRGQVIGLVGNTGSASTGPHLHLTASKDSHGNLVGLTLDPLKLLKGTK